MKKVLLKVAFFGTLLCYSCENTFKDIYGDVKEDQAPSWLGGSIYSELQSGDHLDGTFSTYLRLIDDLGYAEVLDKTGSKTIFPSNDEAFARFFAKNNWGVSSYEDLTYSQKTLLVKSSMLDNALLIGMLSNASAGSTIAEGVAMKHPTNINVIDTINQVKVASMPQNNVYWDYWRQNNKDIYSVSDKTTPTLVHFTREHMVKNNITTTGDNSDFEILTGEKYDSEAKNVFIFNNKVIKSDITCLNGYIHQVKDVLVQPGNMAQIIKEQANTKYWDHILDYYATPYFDAATTQNYNNWVEQYSDIATKYGYQKHDSIFQIRYMSSRSQGSALNVDPNGASKSTTEILRFDPGWNTYYPPSEYNTTGDQNQLSDIAAMFVPTDEAVEDYFLPGGSGEYIINVYGKKPNTKANLFENLDSLQKARPSILTAFVRNLQNASFVSSVPSKFTSLMNDASENLGMNMDKLQTKPGGYDINIANNGVIYKLNQMIAPDEYSAVLAPSSTYKDMQVMNWAVQDWHSDATTSYLSLDYKYFLLSMKSNYAFFIPDDDAFGSSDIYYLDPTTLGHTYPEVIHIYYDATKKSEPRIQAETYRYDLSTNTIGSLVGSMDIGSVNAPNRRLKSALTDILNYHTVVLNNGDTIGITTQNHYYKTKHGGEVYIDFNSNPRTGMEIKSGAAIDNGMPSSKLYTGKASYFSQANGTAYRIDHVIQPTIKSVAEILRTTPQFSKFYNACGIFSNSELLSWIGISAEKAEGEVKSPQERYILFSQQDGSYNSLDAVDGNVMLFNTYNYTLYVPNNNAMDAAYALGLPDVEDIYTKFEDLSPTYPEGCPEPQASELKEKLDVLKNFVRYHFQNISLYADVDNLPSASYQSMYTNNYGLAQEYTVSGGNKQLSLKDAAGNTHTINANNTSMASNQMARDYWLNDKRTTATEIATSSFCVLHELSSALNYNSKTSSNPNARYDYGKSWGTNNVKQRKASMRTKK